MSGSTVPNGGVFTDCGTSCGALARRASSDLPREDILFFGTTREEEVILNCTRIIRVLGIDVWDLTYAEWVGRMQMRQIAAFLKRYVPGFENAYVAQSGFMAGARGRGESGEIR